MREKERLAQWKEPGAVWRSFPFWAWNDKLDPEEIRRQIRQMKAAGVGGFFIHSREGLETPYLGEQWMNCVRAAVEEAKQQGLYAWLYDEDRFPSGSAGGSVPGGGDAFRCKGLTLEVRRPEEYPDIYREEIRGRRRLSDEKPGFLAAYGAFIQGDDLISCRRLVLEEEEQFLEGEMLLAVRLEVSRPSQWFNGEAPPDNLNPDCVKRFLEKTHEVYKAAVGEEFGKTIPGIFTDEPSLHDRHAFFGQTRAWIPWTYGYGAYFQKEAGYDFFTLLPWLYFNGRESARVRRDYWHSVAKRYGETYFKTIGEWCEANHLIFTGHFLQEDKMGLSARVNGAVMPNYQYEQMPGIDLLCQQTDEYMTVKQCVSVARQLGKKRVLTETYGCTGWGFSFEGQKWIGDWQYVLGVNCRCQHLALYSLRGCRKRDYPPSFNYNTTWWKDYKCVEDYFARLSMALTEGEAVREILLLHPLSSVWSRLGVSPYGNPVRRRERDISRLNEYGDSFNRLIEALERSHLDLDLGDEMLIGQYGAVKEGRFFIGKAGYRAVVIPPGMDSMLEETKRLLLQYEEQGGMLLKMKDSTQESIRRLTEALEPARSIGIQRGDGTECRDVLYQLRKTERGYLLFLVNNNRNTAMEVTVRLPFWAEAVQWDPMDGSCRPAEARWREEGLEMTVFLESTGSALYSFALRRGKRTEISKALGCRMDSPNVLPLDQCRFRLEGEDWSEVMEVWQAQREIRSRLGMRAIHRNGLPQRYGWSQAPHPGDGRGVELEFPFFADQELTEIQLAAEGLGEFQIELNGKMVPVKKTGWFLDKSFETMLLGTVRAGENVLRMACRYRNGMELENVYLLGSFAVGETRCLTAFTLPPMVGDWTKKGWKHYCGRAVWYFEYEKEEEDSQTIWRLPKCYGVCVKMRFNGKEFPWFYGDSQEIRPDPYLHKGVNQIELELIGSPRNMMGPFHLKEEPYNTHDASFSPDPEEYSSGYLLEPCGIMGPIGVAEIFKHGAREETEE